MDVKLQKGSGERQKQGYCKLLREAAQCVPRDPCPLNSNHLKCRFAQTLCNAMQCNATEQKKTEVEGNHWEAARYHNLLEDMLVCTVKEPLNLDLMEEGELKVEKDIRK